jgi:hypothetical protein
VFRRVFGQDSLIPDRTQPFSLGMLHAMVSYVKSGLVATWSAALHAAILVLICFCIATGTRKDEFARSHAEDTFLMRANFKLFRGPVCLPMTRANLLAARDGDYICAKSAPSKCDRNNVVWGANDMWFRIKSADPLNFAWQWVQWELAYPCPTEERKTWAAFSPTGTATPFTGQFAAACLDTLMTATIGTAEAALRSWHAFRVTIACALLATDRYKKDPQAGDALIQTMVRWRTPDSIRTYGKMLPSDYADNVDLVTTTDAHRAADLAGTVTIDATAPRIDLEAAIAELERDARPSHKGKASAKDGTPSKVGKAKRPTGSSNGNATPKEPQTLPMPPPDTAKVSVRLQFKRTPAGTRLSMAAACFGAQWAAEQGADRCEGTATRWQTANKTVLLIKWDGWSRATATTIAELDDARNDVRIIKQSGTPEA